MKKLIDIFAILICACCGLLVSSCSKPGEEGMPIIIGINEWTGYDPFILADETDLFNKNNVRVEIKRFASATEEMQALKDGEIQGAGFTLDEVFSLVGSIFKYSQAIVGFMMSKGLLETRINTTDLFQGETLSRVLQ